VIDDEGIEAGTGKDVGDGRAAKRQPASYARVTGGETGFQTVRTRHGVVHSWGSTRGATAGVAVL